MAIKDILGVGENRPQQCAFGTDAVSSVGYRRDGQAHETARAEAGRNDQPSSSSKVLDATEQEFINEVEGKAKSSFDRYLDLQKTYSSRAADANIQSMVLDIDAAASAAVSNFDRKMQVGRSDLYGGLGWDCLTKTLRQERDCKC